MEGLVHGGKFAFQNQLGGRLTIESKFTFFALFFFVFEYKPQGAYIWRGDFMEGFLRYRLGGLIFGAAYTWRGLFSEFYGICTGILRYLLSDVVRKESRGSHGICVCVCSFFFLSKMDFFWCRCAGVYPIPGTCLATATRETEGTENKHKSPNIPYPP